MNNKTALKYIEQAISCLEVGASDAFMPFDALKTAAKALEKQIPAKPLEEMRYYGYGKCPNCGAVFMDNLTNYCWNCGQALDWRRGDVEQSKNALWYIQQRVTPMKTYFLTW